MSGMLRVSRSRGALSGVLLVLLGAWGGLIPFIGPYFHYAYTPGGAWTYTSGRLWLEIAPAVAVIAGGLIVAASSYRPTALFGAWLAAAGGAWFAIGGLTVQLWGGPGVSAGTPAGGTIARALEQIGFFTGLGVAVAFVAALALGRLSVIAVKDTRPAPGEELGAQRSIGQAVRNRFGRRRTALPSPSEEPQPGPAGSARASR
ncbi:MAG TPA: hypothetical protein VIV12_24720 [Streptosporangiaceae bacterium]